MRKTLPLIGVFIIILTGIVFYYEEVRLPIQPYAQPVVVVKKGVKIEPYQKISDKQVDVVYKLKSEILPNTYSNLNEVIGKYAIQAIGEQYQVGKFMIVNQSDILNEDEELHAIEIDLEGVVAKKINIGNKVTLWIENEEFGVEENILEKILLDLRDARGNSYYSYPNEEKGNFVPKFAVFKFTKDEWKQYGGSINSNKLRLGRKEYK